MGPLHGIRVLDLSRVLAGPWATQALADLGADVIKIERPDGGDDTRQWGPPYARDAEGRDTTESAYYLSTNRGKRSVAVDLSNPQGASLVRALARRCDVLVENFKVGGLAKYGLAYADLKAECPGLVYCSISAFGQDGPDADKPGYDAMIQGMGGLMSITGLPDGEPGGGPQKVGVAVVDLMTGMYATTAIIAALYERRASGIGQYIDLALLDTQLGWLANQNMNFLVTGESPRRQGTAHPNIVPYQAFATSDGFLMLAVGNDRQFSAWCSVAQQPQLAADVRFATNKARVAHRAELVPIVAAALRAHPTRWWLDALNAANVPCGPINEIGQVFAEPQIVHRGMRIDLPHPTAGTVPGVKNPINYSRTPLEYRSAPPLLGEHTDTVLEAELGLDSTELARLRAAGAIR
ncbi:MAG TPA: CaiB/BaiF CoA-transferase family protein [Steroidobacteraceae bacterium]|nr:CaiB/BaiF CoA-transferase family protein [Steroidobacteraceae bacterium]HNS27161.1 CaiB/BaiF CoA-transferase family protein [Steroidobacteraceae bacterium]